MTPPLLYVTSSTSYVYSSGADSEVDGASQTSLGAEDDHGGTRSFSVTTKAILATVLKERLEKNTTLDGHSASLRTHVDSLQRLCEALEGRSGRELFPRLFAQIDTSSGAAAKESYLQISDELFRGGTQWGRVIALVAFTGYTAERVTEMDMSELGLSLITWLQEVIVVDHGEWIRQNGGWVSLSLKNKQCLILACL